MIRIRRFNESEDPVYHKSDVTKEDILDLEDHFIDIKDKWEMGPSKWLSNPLTAPNNFHFNDCKFYYHFYLPFNDKIAMSKVGGKSKNVVEFCIETLNTVSAEGLTKDEYNSRLEVVKAELLSDVDRFLDEIGHLGWKVWDWSQSRKNFLDNSIRGTWSNRLEIFIYR
jgi:hypothetical protein